MSSFQYSVIQTLLRPRFHKQHAQPGGADTLDTQSCSARSYARATTPLLPQFFAVTSSWLWPDKRHGWYVHYMRSRLFGALPTSSRPIEISCKACADASIAQSTGSARAMSLSISMLWWRYIPHPYDQRFLHPKLYYFLFDLDILYTGNLLSYNLGIISKYIG